MRRGIVLLILFAACSGVSQAEYDDLETRLDEARDELVAYQTEGAELVAAETAVAAYVAATDPLDIDALTDVYSADLVLFDAARGVTFRTRATALADLASGAAAFGLQAQTTLSTTVAPGGAVVEWEARGVNDIGLDWSFRGASVLTIEEGLVTEEALYYDPSDAPWGG